jgi:trehalose synthase
VGRFEHALGGEAIAQASARMASVRDRLGARTVWQVNSTSEGGGVAEMLQSVLGYASGCGRRASVSFVAVTAG